MLRLDDLQVFVRTAERGSLSAAARELDMPLVWKGKGAAERAVDARTGRTVISLDPRYLRPTEVDSLLGDASRARRELGWKPRIPFDRMVREMTAADLRLAEAEAHAKRGGFSRPRRAAD